MKLKYIKHETRTHGTDNQMKSLKLVISATIELQKAMPLTALVLLCK